MKKGWMIFVLMLLISVFVAAAYDADVEQTTDKLNYQISGTHTIYVTNTRNQSVQANFSLQPGFTYSSTSCTNPIPSLVVCDLAPGQTKFYKIISNTSTPEYTITTFSGVTNNSYTVNNISFIKINDDEIFHTLVEFGRGRGNYFFDSMEGDTAGSGHTGAGCPYLPNGTMFELNFLHKILNIKQYYGLATAEAVNVTFTCTYPDSTVVREHLITAIQKTGGMWVVDYYIKTVGGSWERMGYLGMDFDAGEYNVGDNISVNCTNLNYQFPEEHGNMTITEDAFTLMVRNRDPFNISAAAIPGIITGEATSVAGSTTVGNGTQEMIVRYTVTNTEVYDVSDVVIEIDSPQYSQFIGTRGEIWGAGQNTYRKELTEMKAGQSEVIELVVRFDTSNAPNINSVALAEGVKVQYITCWEANAYNPQKYVQELKVYQNASVNMSVSTNIISIIERLINIYNVSLEINTTTHYISDVVDYINLTLDRAFWIDEVSQVCVEKGRGNNFAWTLNEISGEGVPAANITSLQCQLYYVTPSGANTLQSGATFEYDTNNNGFMEAKWNNTNSFTNYGAYEVVCNTTVKGKTITDLKAHTRLASSCSGGGTSITGDDIEILSEYWYYYNDSTTNLLSNCDDWYSGLTYNVSVQNPSNSSTTATMYFELPNYLSSLDLVSTPASGTSEITVQGDRVVLKWTYNFAAGEQVDLQWKFINTLCREFNDIFEEINYTRITIFDLNSTVWARLTDNEKLELQKELDNVNHIWNQTQESYALWFNGTVNTTALQLLQYPVDLFDVNLRMNQKGFQRRVLETYDKLIKLTIAKGLNVTEFITHNTTLYHEFVYINNRLTIIENKIDIIIEEIEYIKQFDEELVFLVTDAFGLQQSAKKDVADGDLESAATKLSEANEKLNTASARLVELELNTNTELNGSAGGGGYGWVIAVLIGIVAIGGLVVYMFSRPRREA